MSITASEHEQVVYFNHRPSGLKAIVAIYSTALGPALGGTRFMPYASEQAALRDVLDLSVAMAYKAACAGLAIGGGKSVIVGDPAALRSEQLFRAYGRCIDGLAGRIYTACDVGTTVADMDIVARETRYALGGSPSAGGCGDTAIMTALGVYQGMRACAEHRWGSPDLAGRRVGVLGLGKVGARLVEHLVADGARPVVADVDPRAITRVAGMGGVEVLEPAELPRATMDVFAPCALRGTLTHELADRLQAEMVCGGANNQLQDRAVAERLHERSVLYAPDYVVNAGGLIQAADEIHGYREERARRATAAIYDTTRHVLALAQAERVTPLEAADRLAERRMGVGAVTPARDTG